MDVLYVTRGHSQDRNKNKALGGRSKSRGRSKSLGKFLRKCGKTRHYKKDYSSKSVDKGEDFNDVPSKKGNTSSKE
jgi:hypothetical protein